MNTDMKITVNPGMEHLRQFVRQLPELFPVSGEVLHDGRNQIRAFDIGVATRIFIGNFSFATNI